MEGMYIGDSLGYFTYVQTTGCSVVDYTICSEENMSTIKYLSIAPRSHLSDHCMQHFLIRCKPSRTRYTNDVNVIVKECFGKIKWDNVEGNNYSNL